MISSKWRYSPSFGFSYLSFLWLYLRIGTSILHDLARDVVWCALVVAAGVAAVWHCHRGTRMMGGSSVSGVSWVVGSAAMGKGKDEGGSQVPLPCPELSGSWSPPWWARVLPLQAPLQMEGRTADLTVTVFPVAKGVSVT